ncbi:YopX family protein [Paenibacillus polymyxa]|uniref:YopX protein domain-containing protein n=1 Tax=Paenibacillus polymyxa TaxID=1406 RepID=A0ABX2ZG17_PAEPO|nr:YopX family protein [Paenibacillus polymyxa]ODA10527.1 hypothetical protein A7312_23530 [Paenibacillus polymyxa]
MSRPIKFRAWHKKRKRMYEVLILHMETLLNGGIWATVKGRDVIDQKDIHVQIQPKDIIVMQYTGLKDRNGKEIYEGDVIQMDCGCDSEYGCSHGPWHGYVKWDPETASYELRDMDGRWSGEAYEESMIDEYLVVGNIYETPLEDTP